MDGILDFLTPKSEEYFMQGTYYATKPKTTQDIGKSFRYKETEAKSKDEINAINTLATDNVQISIETKSEIDFIEHAYIIDHYGKMYQINSISTKRNDAEQTAYLLWKNPVGIKKVLRCTQITNPRGLK
jgi:hypothetical protein